MNPNIKRSLEIMQDRPLNRKEVRSLLHRKCPCKSGKRYANCCLEDDIRRLVKKQAWMLKEKKAKGKVKITKVKEEGDESKSSKKATHQSYHRAGE